MPDEHSISTIADVMVSGRMKASESRTKNEVKQLLCRLEKGLSELDYHTVINFVNFQNGTIVNLEGELKDQKSLVSSLHEQIEELKKNAQDPQEEHDAES